MQVGETWKRNCKRAQRAFSVREPAEGSECVQTSCPYNCPSQENKGKWCAKWAGKWSLCKVEGREGQHLQKGEPRVDLLEHLLGLGCKFLLLGILYCSMPYAQKSTQSVTCNSENFHKVGRPAPSSRNRSLENMMQNERSQTWKTPYCVIPFIWNVLNNKSLKTRQISGCLGIRGRAW